ncbi:MFS transporter [Clostridium guangxiense]|uniref:MFS transporter n=2 Tax=Clostridium TaxID=1485 RepID=UPI001E65B7C7|nr:MFS transporter [Clostridium guangxiense]MCD2347322.1 MFS transporter [Clostridium guangxiense]
MKTNVMKNRDFLLLLSCKFVSLTGDEIQSFALSLYVLQVTGSAAKFASVMAVAVIPRLIIGPICGVFADWFNRKKIMIILDVINGIVVSSLVLIYKINGYLGMIYIYTAVIILAVLKMFYNSAASAVVPTIVGKESLLRANSVNSTVSFIPEIIGPLISGIVVGFFGIVYIILFNSISFFLSAVIEVFIEIPKNDRKDRKFNFYQFRKDFIDGIRYIKERAILMKITICCFAMNLALNPVLYIGIRYIGKNVFKISDASIGSIQAVFTAGAVIGSIIPGLIKRKIEPSKSFAVSTNLGGILVIFVSFILVLYYNGVITNLMFMITAITILITVMVIFIIMSNVFSATVFQAEAPNEMLGRIGAVVSTACDAAIPIGQVVIGILYDYTKSYVPMFLCGVIMLSSGLYFVISQKFDHAKMCKMQNNNSNAI